MSVVPKGLYPDPIDSLLERDLTSSSRPEIDPDLLEGGGSPGGGTILAEAAVDGIGNEVLRGEGKVGLEGRANGLNELDIGLGASFD